MDDILLLEAIERYLAGDMSAAERSYFETLRKNTPEIDQMVVEHSMFLHQMDIYSVHRNIRQNLQATHAKLLETGEINEGGELTTKGKVIQIWKKYKKVTAIAASVGGVIALIISGLTLYFSPVNNRDLQQLSRDVDNLTTIAKVHGKEIKEVNNKIPHNVTALRGGSGFLIDTKGYIVTNAHVLKGSNVVVGNNGHEYKARIVYKDDARDLAVLKIDDKDFQPLKSLPYAIKRNGSELGEEVYTLGYPRNDIVYEKGYLSARSGYKGDSLAYQVHISAHPGNSGAPVLNHNGEVIGILSARQTETEGVVFAVKSSHIYRMVDELKKQDDNHGDKIKLPSRTSLKGVGRTEQIAQVEDCVYSVKAY